MNTSRKRQRLNRSRSPMPIKYRALKSKSKSRSSSYGGVKELYSYQMQPVYWDIEEYEDEDLNDYNVTVNKQGEPIFINSAESFLDTYRAKKGIFVFTIEGILRMGYRIHHSDMTAGNPVICAGEFRLNSHGQIVTVSNRSGHYLPRSDCLDEVLDFICQNGYNVSIKRKSI